MGEEESGAHREVRSQLTKIVQKSIHKRKIKKKKTQSTGKREPRIENRCKGPEAHNKVIYVKFPTCPPSHRKKNGSEAGDNTERWQGLSLISPGRYYESHAIEISEFFDYLATHRPQKHIYPSPS